MKSAATGIFVGLGVVFLALIVLIVYMFMTDSSEVKRFISGSEAEMNASTTKMYVADNQPTTDTSATPESSSTGFQLSSEQKQALVSLGMDPAAIPSTVSAAQEACFVSVLGSVRVGEIKAGAVPNALELVRAKACI